MFTQTAALEQAEKNSNNKIIAFSPGVMDTDMQETIRSSSKDAFKDLERFKDLKESNKLLKAEAVADALVDLVLKGESESGRVYSINELI